MASPPCGPEQERITSMAELSPPRRGTRTLAAPSRISAETPSIGCQMRNAPAPKLW